MAIPIQCPACLAYYNLRDGQAGQRVRCRNCQQVFAVPANAGIATVLPVEEPDEENSRRRRICSERVPEKESSVQTGRNAARTRPPEPDDDDRSRQRKHAPAPSRKSSGVLVGLIVGGAVAVGVLLLAVIVVAGWRFVSLPVKSETGPLVMQVERTSFPEAHEQAAAEPQNQADEQKPEANRIPEQDLPRTEKPAGLLAVQGPVAEPAPGIQQAANDAIPLQKLQEIKNATTFVIVKSGPLTATGSGFLIMAKGDTGYVVTNDHVVHKLAQIGRPGQAAGPPRITLVFGSGTADERSVDAQVVASDSRRDLAVLKVTGVKNLPKPVVIEHKPKYVETMSVYIFGFPFGQLLATNKRHPAITINKGSVSSIRLNDKGEMAVVQIDGAINPGNSGGPVVDSDGKLIGIAVATIRGSGIGLAIPTDELTKSLKGQLGAIHLSPKAKTAGGIVMQVEFELLDPLNEITAVSIRYLPTALVTTKPKPSADGAWPVLPGSRKLDLTINNQRAIGTFTVAGSGRGEIGLTIQTAFINREGKTRYTEPTNYRVDARLEVAAGVPASPSPSPNIATPGAPRAAPSRPGPSIQPPAPVDIKPPSIGTEKVVRMLPAPIGDMVVGGGGRYLIFHLPQVRKLAIFDASEGRMAKYLSLSEDKIKIAAGMNHFVIVLGDKKIIQRWSLSTFEREAAAPLPFQHNLVAIAMGSASRGPLLVMSSNYPIIGELFYFDIQAMRKIELERKSRVHQHIVPGVQVRAAANGQVFTAFLDATVQSFVLSGSEVREYQSDAAAPASPSPDGKVIHATNGLYTNELKPLSRDVQRSLPAERGPFFLSLLPRQDEGNSGCRLSVHVAGDSRPIVQPEGIEIAEASLRDSSFPVDRQVHLIANAKLIVVVPATKDRLELYQFDIDLALAKSDIDYLFVVSQPPAVAQRGAIYTYPLAVKSRKGGVKYRLDSGPAGMEISSSGVLTWRVPGDIAEPEADVILSIGDGSGQEVFHNFKIAITGQTAPDENKISAVPRPAESKAPDSSKPLAAPALEQPRVVRMLPSIIDDVAVGGGGRYLIMRLPQQRKLAIFDVSLGRVVRYLNFTEDGSSFAAGMDKLLVALPGRSVLERWNLATLEREVTVALPVQGKVRGLAMGSASQGPLLVRYGDSDRLASGGNTLFLDVRTLKPLSLELPENRSLSVGEGEVVRVSADGRVFTTTNPDSSPQGMNIMILNGKQLRQTGCGDSAGHVVPAPDGKFIYTARGVYSQEGKPVANTGGNSDFYALPAVQGNFYMLLKPAQRDQIGIGKGGAGTIGVYLAGDTRPLVTLTDIELPDAINSWDRERFATDKRIHFLPAVRLFITIPATNDRLILQRFDLEEALEKSGIDYLVVTSQPPVSAKRGATFTYAVVAKSKRGGTSYRLDSGPPGMTFSKDGKMTWTVPNDWAELETDVIVAVTDSTGQECLHTFTIKIDG